MKKLIVILVLSLPFTLSAQPYCAKKEFKMPEWSKAAICLGGSIICEAIADGMYDNGNKKPAHFMGALSTGLLLAYPIWEKQSNNEPFWAVPSYICFRIAMFDPIYNQTRGLPIGYVGSTSTWDEMMNKINPGDGLIFLRCVVFTFGIYFTIQL